MCRCFLGCSFITPFVYVSSRAESDLTKEHRQHLKIHLGTPLKNMPRCNERRDLNVILIVNAPDNNPTSDFERMQIKRIESTNLHSHLFSTFGGKQKKYTLLLLIGWRFIQYLGLMC